MFRAGIHSSFAKRTQMESTATRRLCGADRVGEMVRATLRMGDAHSLRYDDCASPLILPEVDLLRLGEVDFLVA